MDKSDLKKRLRFQFTLRSFIATLVIALLAFSHWNTSRELKTTRDALIKLRSETGELVVSDPTKLQVVAIRTIDSETRQWRVHVPPGHEYDLTLELHDLAETFPGESTEFVHMLPGNSLRPQNRILSPGEWLVSFRTQGGLDEQKAEVWSAQLAVSGPGVGSHSTQSMGSARLPWMSPPWSREYKWLGGQETEVLEAGASAALLELRAWRSQARTSSDKPKLEVLLLPRIPTP
jgi:hypothetical protein